MSRPRKTTKFVRRKSRHIAATTNGGISNKKNDRRRYNRKTTTALFLAAVVASITSSTTPDKSLKHVVVGQDHDVSQPQPLTSPPPRTPPDCGVSERRSWRDLSCDGQDEFIRAVRALKDNGWYDEFVYTHWLYSDLTHQNDDLFLPWHRYFLWMFERALQTVTQSCITVPYWDWERDYGVWDGTNYNNNQNAGDVGMPLILEDETFGRFDRRVQSRLDGWCSWVTWGTGDCLERQVGRPEWSAFSGEAEILALITNYRTFQDTSNANLEELNNGFARALEGTPHRRPHEFLAGSMIDMTAPDDPLFYLHHANIDRIWALWQDWWDHDAIRFRDRFDFSSPLHYADTGWWNVDEPMPFPEEGDIDWSFAIPVHRARGWIAYPTIRQVLNQRGPLINVRYVNDHLASLIPQDEFFPNLDWFEPAIDEVPVRCRRARQSDRRRGQEQEQSDTTSRGKRLRRPERTTTENMTDSCSQRVVMFTKQVDRDRWIQLCHDLPSMTPFSERIAVLAEMGCENSENQSSTIEHDYVKIENEKKYQYEKMKMMYSVQSHHPTLHRAYHRRDSNNTVATTSRQIINVSDVPVSISQSVGTNGADSQRLYEKPVTTKCFRRPDE